MTEVREGLTAEFVKQLPKNGHRGARDVDYVIDVPADPGPTFQLVIPDNYCGLLRIRFESVEEVAVASQRVYTVEVGVDGRAVVRLPNASRAARDGRNIAAREKSWKPIRWECDSNSERIGLRHVHHTEDTELYLIGTGAEAEAMNQKLHPVRESGKREFDPVAYEKLFNK